MLPTPPVIGGIWTEHTYGDRGGMRGAVHGGCGSELGCCSAVAMMHRRAAAALFVPIRRVVTRDGRVHASSRHLIYCTWNWRPGASADERSRVRSNGIVQNPDVLAGP